MEKKHEPGEFCRVHFRVKCNTDVGQVVGVSGNCYALGNSKKENVVHLVTTPESHPIWYTASPLVIPRGDAIHYRYCLVEGGTVKSFESVDSAREITLDNIDTTIEDEFLLGKLDGFGEDPEKELFEQMRQLTRKYSEADKMVWLNAAQRDSRLFLVCYHLPVIVKRTGNPEDPFEVIWNESILARSQSSSIADSMRTCWVGTLSVSLQSLSARERQQLEAQLHAMDIIPVVIDDDIAAAAYYGFCKQIMWPVFHNVDQLDQIHAAWNLQDDFRQARPLPHNALPLVGAGNRSRTSSNTTLATLGIGAAAGAGSRSRSNSMASPGAENNRVLEWNNLEEEFHLAHEAVNLIFARTLLGLVNNEDVVWVHDYHLMPLPKLLRAKESKSRRRSSSADVEKDARNASCTHTEANEKITAAADAPLEVPARLKDLRIIFFMHIPFPTSQLFRTLPRASDLLESMICADVVGFHAFDHARHFLNATKRMLGIRSGSRPGGMITLSVADREVLVTVSHVSIETEKIGPAAIDPETLRIARDLRLKYAGKRIVVGVDVCQRLSGVALKLAAFDKMLSDSSWGRRGNVVLVQKCIRGNTRPGDEETTAADLRKMVADINGKYAHAGDAARYAAYNNRLNPDADAQLTPTGSLTNGHGGGSSNSSHSTSRGSTLDSLPGGAYNSDHPARNVVVDYEERDSSNELTVHERLALWLVADVFLLTPIREGLNLMPLEYIYTRRDLPNAGAVVVSEFSTCSALLNGSLKVNPFAPLRVADALEKALMLSSRDKELRRQRDLPFISSHPSGAWTHQVVNDLEQLQSNCGRGRTGAASGPVPLLERQVLESYNDAAQRAGICQAGSRVFIFDYGGTLLHKEKYDIYIKRQTLSAIAGRKPSDEIMHAIERLSNDPHNVVVVITGLTKQKLGDTFAGMRNVTLATSNGLVYSWGQNLLPAPHHKRTRLHHLATAAAAAVKASHSNHGNLPHVDSDQQIVGVNTAAGTNTSLASLVGARALELGEVTQDLIALSLADGEREWGYQGSSIDWQAVSNIALPIISKFTVRTNGTCQSPRIPGIGWSYFGADPEEGYKMAKQLTLELEASLARFDVKVTSLIQSSLEVVPRNLHKGLLIKPLLEKVMGRRGGRLPGFLMVVGDEESDDKMVEVVYETLGSVAPSAGLGSCRTFATCVGKRNCPAQYYLNDVEDVQSLLTRLANAPTTAACPPLTTSGTATPGAGSGTVCGIALSANSPALPPGSFRSRGSSEAPEPVLIDVVGAHL